MRGRKKLPEKIKELKGTQKKIRINRNEPEPELANYPEPPPELTEIAKKEWTRIAPKLQDLKILTNLDLSALAAYCFSFAIWVECNELIKIKGLMILAPSGYPIVNPALSQANKAQAEMRKWLVEFGMTPSSRGRISVDKKEKKKGFMDD